MIVAGALAIAQDQETLRVRTPLAASDPRFPEYLAPPARRTAHLGRHLRRSHRWHRPRFRRCLTRSSRARHRVSFETYVYHSGEVADRFTDAFEAAARRGVDVRIVLDSIGASKGSRRRTSSASGTPAATSSGSTRSSGFELEELNYRTHRKSFIVDGDVAFVGGIGVADHWALDTGAGLMWRDTQVEVRGPAAVVHRRGRSTRTGSKAARSSSRTCCHTTTAPQAPPDRSSSGADRKAGASAMKLLYLLAIASARTTLDIESPYLMTDESTRVEPDRRAAPRRARAADR